MKECEYCKKSMPPEDYDVDFCSIECFEANEREAREQAESREHECLRCGTVIGYHVCPPEDQA